MLNLDSKQKTKKSLVNMKNCLKHRFINYWFQRRQKFDKMMFPIRNDVNVECEPPGTCAQTTSNKCKIVKTAATIIAIIFFLLIVNSWTPVAKEEKEEEKFMSSSPCTVEIGEKMKEEIRSWIQKEVQLNSKVCSKTGRLGPEQMRNIVKEEIKRQQKIQLKPDFASASAGGIIIEASPTWTEGYSYIYFLFIPIRSTAPPPSIVLEPTRQAGDCWPMEGRSGKLVIQLAARANIVGFTMEHIDPAMSLSGATPEAPANFSVYGLEEYNNHEKRHLFGTYCYDNKNDEESQYFRVQNINRKSFLYILVEISSNHGNEKYTCLYRFQVHGFIDRAYHCAPQYPQQ